MCVFLINTTMKVGCAEASGTLEQCLLATDHCYAPHPHYIHYPVPDVFRQKYCDELAEL